MIKKVLIIGASHFIGYSLAKRLNKLGFYVNGVVDTNCSDWRLHEIQSVIDVTKINFSQPEKLLDLIKISKPDHILFISNYGAKAHQIDKFKIEYENYLLLKEVLGAAIENQFETFIHFGTFLEKYTESNSSKINDESTEFFRETKRKTTLYLEQEAKEKNLPIYTIRPTFIYGPYFSDKTLFGNFILKCVFQQEVMLNPNIINKDYIHIKDVVNFAVSILLIKPQNSFVFECGSGNILDFSKLVNLLKQNIPSISIKNLDINYKAELTTTPQQEINSYYKKDFLWEPKIAIDSGLEELIKWTAINGVIYKEILQKQCCLENLLKKSFV